MDIEGVTTLYDFDPRFQYRIYRQPTRTFCLVQRYILQTCAPTTHTTRPSSVDKIGQWQSSWKHEPSLFHCLKHTK